MRIRMFGNFIESENLTKHFLKDSTVVVDAKNFFYQLYRTSNLQYIFGCESEKFANYLKDYLSMFKKANVKCYFIFKGGHEDMLKRLTTNEDNEISGRGFDINKYKYYPDRWTRELIVGPILMKDVWMQVLDEMGFDYTVCEFDSKRQCIALAQKLKCAVISHDIEFCFSGLPYIMQPTLRYDEENKRIECEIFSLDDFLKRHHLTEEKLALFAAITDEKGFPENHFIDFVRSFRIPLGHYKRNKSILQWVARNTRESALHQFFRYTNQKDRATFLDIERNFKDLIRRKEQIGITSTYLQNGDQIEITENDEFWFQKGVASKYIQKQLINLARSNLLEGTWAIADYTADDARLVSMDIMKYTYNLLTNFEKESFIFVVHKQEIPISVTNSIEKPVYDGSTSPFENGWEHLKGELFEYFLTETLQGFEKVNKLPEDLRMLMTALIYFGHKKTESIKDEVCSIILSYTALGVVTEEDSNSNAKENPNGEFEVVTEDDKMIAKGIFAKYLTDVQRQEAKRIFDVKLLHPLVEFQHCLQSLNHLNILCGKFYKPTIYSKTFNATFVYKILYTIKKDFDGTATDFVKHELDSAPTVLSYVLRIMEVFDEITSDM